MAKKYSLTAYSTKRDFARTSEPSAKRKRTSARAHIFVVQKHDASHLHYDFRLEIDGVLKSWAVPKGPSMDPSQKRLAVLTEDHPLDYAKFEGTIPEDQYGGGTVMIWDTGRYLDLKAGTETAEKDLTRAFEQGRLEIVLAGKKLSGSFALVRTRLVGKQPQWLLIKMKDEYARPGSDILAEEPDSALSGRSLKQIAKEK